MVHLRLYSLIEQSKDIPNGIETVGDVNAYLGVENLDGYCVPDWEVTLVENDKTVDTDLSIMVGTDKLNDPDQFNIFGVADVLQNIRIIANKHQADDKLIVNTLTKEPNLDAFLICAAQDDGPYSGIAVSYNVSRKTMMNFLDNIVGEFEMNVGIRVSRNFIMNFMMVRYDTCCAFTPFNNILMMPGLENETLTNLVYFFAPDMYNPNFTSNAAEAVKTGNVPPAFFIDGIEFPISEFKNHPKYFELTMDVMLNMFPGKFIMVFSPYGSTEDKKVMDQLKKWHNANVIMLATCEEKGSN